MKSALRLILTYRELRYEQRFFPSRTSGVVCYERDCPRSQRGVIFKRLQKISGLSIRRIYFIFATQF